MQISVSSIIIPNWTFGGGGATLRIVANNSFFTGDGVQILRGSAAKNSFYKTIPCVVSGKTVQCPAFTIDSTTDSSDPNTTYSAYLYDAKNVKRADYLTDFKIPTSLGNSITWEQVSIYSSTAPRPPSPGFPNTDQVNVLIQQQIQNVALPDATTTVKGKVTLSVAGGTAAVAENHAGIAFDIRKYGNTLLAAKTAIGSTPTRLAISVPISAAGVTALPKNISLVFDMGGMLTNVAGALDIKGCIEAAPDQQIFSLTATGGTDTLKSQLANYVILRSSPIEKIYPEWFGAKGDDSGDDYLAIKAAIAASAGYSNEFASRKAKAIHFSKGYYDVSKQLYFFAKTTITGEGGGSSTGGNGDTYSATVLRFPVNIGGMYFDSYSTTGNLGDSAGSVLKDFELRGSSSGNFNANASGIEARRNLIIDNLTVDTFAGHAIFINGTDGAVADNNSITNTSAAFNSGDGFRFEGVDSQVSTITNCSALNNSGVGFHDLSLTGNSYNSNHGRYNVVADYRSDGPGNYSTYTNCYSEAVEGSIYGGNDFGESSIFIGGTLGSNYSRHQKPGGKMTGIKQESGRLALFVPRIGATGISGVLNLQVGAEYSGDTVRIGSSTPRIRFETANVEMPNLTVTGAIYPGTNDFLRLNGIVKFNNSTPIYYQDFANITMANGTATYSNPRIDEGSVITLGVNSAITGSVKWSRAGSVLTFTSSVGTDTGIVSVAVTRPL